MALTHAADAAESANSVRAGPGSVLSALQLRRRARDREATLHKRGRRRVRRALEAGLLAADAHTELARLDERAAVVPDDGELVRFEREAHHSLLARLEAHALDARERTHGHAHRSLRVRHVELYD